MRLDSLAQIMTAAIAVAVTVAAPAFAADTTQADSARIPFVGAIGPFVLWYFCSKRKQDEIVDLIASRAAIATGFWHLPEPLPLGSFSLIGKVAWLAYFYRSVRVRRVFETKDWPLPASPTRPDPILPL